VDEVADQAISDRRAANISVQRRRDQSKGDQADARMSASHRDDEGREQPEMNASQPSSILSNRDP